MGQILLKNETGDRSGRYVRYDFGEDLFGYYFIDIVGGRRHRARLLQRHLFASSRDFVCALDRDLDFREGLHYVR